LVIREPAMLPHLALCALSFQASARARHALPARAKPASMEYPTPFWEYSFITVQPTYTVHDWPAAKRAMAEFMDAARSERGAMYCGWTSCGDQLFCREAYHDAGSAIAHMQNVRPSISKLLNTAATLDVMEVHGPAAELAKCRDVMVDYSPEWCEVDSGCTSIVRPYAGMSRGQSHYSVDVSYKVVDWETARPLLDESVARMRKTPSCIFFGWTKSDGDRLHCRQAYTNADGVLAHIASVDPVIEKLISGPARIVSLRIHGPKTGNEAVVTAMSDYHGQKAEYFAIDSGFQKFEVTQGLPQNPLGMLDYSLFD